ncbi:unnamed protein product [Prorocentrum cordatum]|uniref:SAM domain-containing protein n=1 Tax=Prorocentrum cordatum TaxID=2364126 RepID=A0ABN9XVM2_9DINO|nr:unnamed protein product [Polarella glacialis]
MEWGPKVAVLDASEWGYGVMERRCDAGAIKYAGRYFDRTRDWQGGGGLEFVDPVAGGFISCDGGQLFAPGPPPGLAHPDEEDGREEKVHHRVGANRVLAAAGRKLALLEPRPTRLERGGALGSRPLSALEDETVGLATQRDYRSRFSCFARWASKEGLSLKTPLEADGALVAWLNEQFFEKELLARQQLAAAGAQGECMMLDGPEFDPVVPLLASLQESAAVGRRLLPSLAAPPVWQLRRGGASREALTEFRSYKTGRWHSPRPAKRCERGSDNQVLRPLTPEELNRALEAERTLGACLSRTCRDLLGLAALRWRSLPEAGGSATAGGSSRRGGFRSSRSTWTASSHDLSSRAAQRRILGWILSGCYKAVWLGAPCSTFSRARDSGAGPPRLRSDEQPLGLGGLSEGGRVKVEVANELCRFSAEALMCCLERGVPAALGNPASSRLWLTPYLFAAGRRRGMRAQRPRICCWCEGRLAPGESLALAEAGGLLEVCALYYLLAFARQAAREARLAPRERALLLEQARHPGAQLAALATLEPDASQGAPVVPGLGALPGLPGCLGGVGGGALPALPGGARAVGAGGVGIGAALVGALAAPGGGAAGGAGAPPAAAALGAGAPLGVVGGAAVLAAGVQLDSLADGAWTQASVLAGAGWAQGMNVELPTHDAMGGISGASLFEVDEVGAPGAAGQCLSAQFRGASLPAEAMRLDGAFPTRGAGPAGLLRLCAQGPARCGEPAQAGRAVLRVEWLRLQLRGGWWGPGCGRAPSGAAAAAWLDRRRQCSESGSRSDGDGELHFRDAPSGGGSARLLAERQPGALYDEAMQSIARVMGLREGDGTEARPKVVGYLQAIVFGHHPVSQLRVNAVRELQALATAEPEAPFDEPSVDAEDVDPCGDEPGLAMLLVSKFSATVGEKRWVCTDPTGRLQVIDLGQPARVKSTRFAGVNHGSFQGLSAAEKSKAIEAADRIIATGSAATTGKITRVRHPRGTAAGSTFVLWRAVVYLNAMEWVKWGYASLKETVDTVDHFKEEVEMVFEMHESGALEPLYFSVLASLASSLIYNVFWYVSSCSSWLELALMVGHAVTKPVWIINSQGRGHPGDVEQDSMAAAASVSEPRVVSSTPNPEIDSLVRGLDDSFKDMRELAKEKLQSYCSDMAWTIPGGIRTRVAPSMVARLYRSGASAVSSVRERIRTKQLDGNHMAEEALFISTMLDRSMVEAPADWINYKTTELAMRRLHGIESAFEHVKQRSDWKPPNGSKAGWKSRVNYALLEELDASKSDQGGLLIDGVERELRERLAHRALLAKSLDKLQEWGMSHELPRRISERVLQCHRGARDRKMRDSDAESAFERLALHAKPGAYLGFNVSDKDNDDAPQRGKVMPFVGGEASLPPAGAQPCDVRMISPKASYYFDRLYERMRLPPSQVHEADIKKTRAYMDPSLRNKSARLQFALRLWESGVLGFTKVGEAGQLILRPVWDLRQVNKRFQKPPRLSLGSLMAMAELDLSDEIAEGRILQSTWGGVPDYFHRCKSCSELWPCMVFGGATVPQLLKELKRHGKDIPKTAFIYWVFMDDFASMALQRDEKSEVAEASREHAGKKLKEVGLDMHKVHILWESVTNELYMLYHLAPLMYTHLESQWSSSVFATDASEVPPMKFMADIFSGYGGFGQAIREELQCQTLVVDHAKQARHDLLDPSFVENRSLDNSRTSMIWDLPGIAKLLTMNGVLVVGMAYCSFGARLKKPARIPTIVQALKELERGCSQDHDHQELRGRDSQGRLWTRLAAIYPPRMCNASCVAKAVSNNELKLHDWRMREVRGASPKPIAVMSHRAKVSRWHLAWKGAGAYHDHINVQEVRTAASVSRHLCRSSRNWFSRVLVLCDSMVAVGAVRKIRSSSRPLMTQLKKIGAITLATGIRLTLRWIPADMNPADGPSRCEEIGGAEITKTKSEQKRTVMDSDFEFERLFGDMLEIRGMHDDYDLVRVTAAADPKSNDQSEDFHFDSDHTFDNDDEPRLSTWECSQDNANLSYIKEVKPFLMTVCLRRLPVATAAERDIALAAELDDLCFVERVASELEIVPDARPSLASVDEHDLARRSAVLRRRLQGAKSRWAFGGLGRGGERAWPAELKGARQPAPGRGKGRGRGRGRFFRLRATSPARAPSAPAAAAEVSGVGEQPRAARVQAGEARDGGGAASWGPRVVAVATAGAGGAAPAGPTVRARAPLAEAALPRRELRGAAGDLLRELYDGGPMLLNLFRSFPGSLGRYVRDSLDPQLREHMAAQGGRLQRDLLPLPYPAVIKSDVAHDGEDLSDESWGALHYRLVLTVLALNWEAGFRSLKFARCCRGRVNAAQRAALIGLARRLFLAARIETSLPGGLSWESRLKYRKIGYGGSEITTPHKFTLEQVLDGLPPPGVAASIEAADLATGFVRDALLGPSLGLLPPAPRRTAPASARARACESEWHRIVEALHVRGMIAPIAPSEIACRDGAPLPDGAFGVPKARDAPVECSDGELRPVLRLITNLILPNMCQECIVGDAPEMPTMNQLSGLVLAESEDLLWSGVDGKAFFYVFRAPPPWWPRMVIGPPVPSRLLGLKDGGATQTCMCVIGMGWISVVGVTTHPHRNMLRRSGSVPRGLSPSNEVTRRRRLPLGVEELCPLAWTVYIDNLEIAEIVDKSEAERLRGAVPALLADARACYATAGSPGCLGKDLHRVVCATTLGELVEGVEGVRRPPAGYIAEIVSLTLWVPGKKRASMRLMCILLGRRVCVHCFRRPLAARFAYAWRWFGDARSGGRFSVNVAEDLLMCLALSALCVADMRLEVDHVVTASEASEAAGAVVCSTALSDRGRALAARRRRPASAACEEETALITLFDVVGGGRRAFDILGLVPAVHLSLEVDPQAVRVARRCDPGTQLLAYVCSLDAALATPPQAGGRVAPLDAVVRETLVGFAEGRVVPCMTSAEAKAAPTKYEALRRSLVGNSFQCEVVAWLLSHWAVAVGLLVSVPSLAELRSSARAWAEGRKLWAGDLASLCCGRVKLDGQVSRELGVAAAGCASQEPPAVVFVGRGSRRWSLEPSCWGNPFAISPSCWRNAVALFAGWLRGQPQLLSRLEDLRGATLACRCGQAAPCHADVLLAVLPERVATSWRDSDVSGRLGSSTAMVQTGAMRNSVRYSFCRRLMQAFDNGVKFDSWFGTFQSTSMYWSARVEDVGRYLGEELNLPALGQLFVKHHVGGQELLDLTEEHLEGTFGIRNFLLREHIMRSVAKLRLRRALAARSRSQHPAHAAGDHLSRTCARRPEASQGGSPRLAGSAPSSPACARRGALRPAERPDADADAPPAVSRGHAEEAPSAAGEAAGACAAAGVGGCPGRTWCTPPQHRVTITQ